MRSHADCTLYTPVDKPGDNLASHFDLSWLNRRISRGTKSYRCLLSHVYYFRLAALCLKKMYPDSMFAESDAGSDVGLHGTAIVIMHFANCFMLGMMCVPAEDDIGAFFVGIFYRSFSDGMNRPGVVFAIVF